MCTLVFSGKILLAKRGYGLADAEGVWSTINGFIDEDKSITAFAIQEVLEEIGLKIKPQQVKVADSYTLSNPQEKRNYIVFPCLIKLTSKPTIKLDREHTTYTWIERQELEHYETLDDLPYAVDAALAPN